MQDGTIFDYPAFLNVRLEDDQLSVYVSVNIREDGCANDEVRELVATLRGVMTKDEWKDDNDMMGARGHLTTYTV